MSAESGKIHSLAHIYQSNAKAGIVAFQREPHTVTVPFTEPQRVFYQALMDFRREVLLQTHNPVVVDLITDTLQRQAASCLPALIPSIDAFLKTGRFSLNIISDDPESEDFETDLPAELLDQARELKELARTLPDEDPKI
jgi:hypothetical protein